MEHPKCCKYLWIELNQILSSAFFLKMNFQPICAFKFYSESCVIFSESILYIHFKIRSIVVVDEISEGEVIRFVRHTFWGSAICGRCVTSIKFKVKRDGPVRAYRKKGSWLSYNSHFQKLDHIKITNKTNPNPIFRLPKLRSMWHGRLATRSSRGARDWSDAAKMFIANSNCKVAK